MVVSRVKFEPELSDMTDVILKLKGNIALVAKHYKVTRETVYQYLRRHPAAQETIETSRAYMENDMLDAAEYIMELGLKMYDSDFKKAFEAAKYVLDNKGHKRGWGTDGKPQHEKAVDNQLGTLIGQSEEIYKRMKEDRK